MKNILDLVKNRRSVRSFDERPLSDSDKQHLCDCLASLGNPYGLKLDFKLVDNMETPVITGTKLYVCGKLKKDAHHNEAFSYAFEKFVLFAQSLGVGTTWIGGTMDRAAFEKSMELAEDETMPCISPIGYPAKKMSIREVMMRKGVKADTRLDFDKIAFCGDFEHPMTKETAGDLALPIEAVRLAPSAVNKQPWRMLVCGEMVHFYLQRSKGFNASVLDMQKVDMGIALCHFELAAAEEGLKTEWTVCDPDALGKGDMEYIASYRITQ